MAGFESNEWLQRNIRTAACVDHADVSADALGVLAGVLPTLSRSFYRTDLYVSFLADPKVPYGTAATLFAAIRPASATETAAFLCRSDVPTADVVRIVASERRTTALLSVAELTGRDIAVYEAVVSAFGKAMQKTSPVGGFAVLLALLTSPDVPLTLKAAAAAVPSAYAWGKYVRTDTPAYACWEELKSSEQLQAAAFDGLSLPDSMLLDCASWQCLSTTQLRVVFAAMQSQLVHNRKTIPDDVPSVTRRLARFTGFVDPRRLLDDLLSICDHVAATAEFLTEVDDWFDEYPFPDLTSTETDPYFWFTYRKHRRQGHPRVDPTEFWATYPEVPLDDLTLSEWSRWTHISSVSELVEVLAESLSWRQGIAVAGWSSWLISPLTPLISSASSAELLAGLEAAAATGMPDVLAAVEELCWHAASYDALTFDVLRRMRQTPFPSPPATMRLLELFAATLGPDPELWQVFDKVSVPDASIGEVLDLATKILEPGPP